MRATNLTSLAYEKSLRLVAGRLRAEGSKEAAREALPARWVDLIHHLDEQERRQSAEMGLHRPRLSQEKSGI